MASRDDGERFEEAPRGAGVAVSRFSRVHLAALLGVLVVGAVGEWVGGLWVALGAVAGALGAAAFALRPRRVIGPARRGLILRGTTLTFDAASGAPPVPVVDLSVPFGLTLVANRARSRIALALTTSTDTFYVGADVREDERVSTRPLLAAAFTVATDERALEAAAPDGAPLTLGVSAFARLYDALMRLDPRAPGRLFLSDARGQAVTLDGPQLAAGTRAFDLTSSLEWRGMLFRERAFGGGVAVYQGTHVRQGGTEIVFVSLMPALTSPSVPGDVLSTSEPVLERAVLRDLSLMHEQAEDPPPGNVRVAVERVFMLPIRAALSSARQRTSSKPDLGRHERPLRLS
jgi:hypothetical protein